MGKEERKRRVLSFLVETRIAMPRVVLFRNLSYRGAAFSESSVKNYLNELRAEGLVERIDAEAFANGQVRISNDDPGYWIATSEGVDLITTEAEQENDIDTSHL